MKAADTRQLGPLGKVFVTCRQLSDEIMQLKNNGMPTKIFTLVFDYTPEKYFLLKTWVSVCVWCEVCTGNPHSSSFFSFFYQFLTFHKLHCHVLLSIHTQLYQMR